MEPSKPKKKWRALPNGESFNQAAWKDARRRAIQSKPHYCGECTLFIDVTLPYKLPDGKLNPMSVEVDHEIPISRGGPPYELNNLRLLHTKCNRKKGAKMRSDYAGLEVANLVPISNPW